MELTGIDRKSCTIHIVWFSEADLFFLFFFLQLNFNTIVPVNSTKINFGWMKIQEQYLCCHSPAAVHRSLETIRACDGRMQHRD